MGDGVSWRGGGARSGHTVVARWVAGRRAEKGWTWNGTRDARLGKSTVADGGHWIQGLGRWRGPPLAEERSRRPSFLMAR